MKTSKLLIGCFALVAVAQLTVPAWMIVSHERTLLTGKRLSSARRLSTPTTRFADVASGCALSRIRCR